MADFKDNAKKAADETVDATKKAADKTADVAKKAGHEVADGAKKAGHEVSGAAQNAADEINKANSVDLIALVAGIVAIVFSFFHHYVVGKLAIADLGEETAGMSTWATGWSTFGTILLIIATVLVALAAFAGKSLPAAPWRLIAAGVAAVGALTLIIRAFSLTEHESLGDVVEESVSVGWSGWVVIIAGLVLAAAAGTAVKHTKNA